MKIIFGLMCILFSASVNVLADGTEKCADSTPIGTCYICTYGCVVTSGTQVIDKISQRDCEMKYSLVEENCGTYKESAWLDQDGWCH